MKIVVQGNCQSRPVSTFMAAACDNAELMPPIVTQLQSDSDYENNYKAFCEADYIFAQWVSDDYHVQHLSTSKLKLEFGNKVVSWPNAFYIGQCPDIVAIATKEIARVIGPLDTYHVRSIFKSWINGVSVADCLNELNDESAPNRNLLASIDVSLAELKKREELLDIKISDFIEKYWLDEKIFHVFNHPTNTLLVELVNRLCKFVNLDNTTSILPEFWPEQLDRVIAPNIPAISKELGFKYKTSSTSKGFSLVAGENNSVSLGKVSIVSLEKLVEQFYFAYDCQLSKTDEYAFTPGYLQERYQVEKAA